MSHSLLFTHKAWQFDDGDIECPDADLERGNLVEQSIKKPFLGEPERQRTAFAAATTRNTLVRSGKSVFRRLAAAGRQSRGSPLLRKAPRCFKRSAMCVDARGTRHAQPLGRSWRQSAALS
ncbi:hypothetical protein ISCGN_006763 [Ixodes scapularis]